MTRSIAFSPAAVAAAALALVAAALAIPALIAGVRDSHGSRTRSPWYSFVLWIRYGNTPGYAHRDEADADWSTDRARLQRGELTTALRRVAARVLGATVDEIDLIDDIRLNGHRPYPHRWPHRAGSDTITEIMRDLPEQTGRVFAWPAPAPVATEAQR